MFSLHLSLSYHILESCRVWIWFGWLAGEMLTSGATVEMNELLRLLYTWLLIKGRDEGVLVLGLHCGPSRTSTPPSAISYYLLPPFCSPASTLFFSCLVCHTVVVSNVGSVYSFCICFFSLVSSLRVSVLLSVVTFV